MPAIFVIQGDFSPLVTQLYGLLTCAIALIRTGAIMHLILERNPFALRESGIRDGAQNAEAVRRIANDRADLRRGNSSVNIKLPKGAADHISNAVPGNTVVYKGD
ncbi:hypothetical protein NW762_012783 [Fusarium torreyae]|uniref:Uncharacterized protein n=1 Tax=Fusarium torreyae TaxID=1237075 RepID=A0A9W8RR51_9HYPO|nr:hypothetical protein NW762_012783 [Fusarium torreyae]